MRDRGRFFPASLAGSWGGVGFFGAERGVGGWGRFGGGFEGGVLSSCVLVFDNHFILYILEDGHI